MVSRLSTQPHSAFAQKIPQGVKLKNSINGGISKENILIGARYGIEVAEEATQEE